MSQNRSSNDPTSTSARTTGGAGTGATDAGTTRDTSTSIAPTGGGSTGTGAGAATGTAARAQEVSRRVGEAATQAKDYVADKISVVGDKFRDLQNKDFIQVADDAKQYARQNPGQALLISAAAGFVIGLLIRGSRR